MGNGRAREKRCAAKVHATAEGELTTGTPIATVASPERDYRDMTVSDRRF